MPLRQLPSEYSVQVQVWVQVQVQVQVCIIACRLFRPKMIIAGFSAYSRHLDYPRFRQICDKVSLMREPVLVPGTNRFCFLALTSSGSWH